MGRTRKRPGTTILFYVFMVAMALNVYFLTTGLLQGIVLFPLTSTFITFQITSLFNIYTISQVFGELFISSDDYNNLSFRPMDNRTYFLSKLTSIATQLYIVTAIMTIPPTIALLIDIRILECIGYIISNFLLQTCVAVLALIGFMHIAKIAIAKGRDPSIGLIGGIVVFAMIAPTFWYYLFPKMRFLEFPTDIPVWADIVNPFSWYASVPAILDGSVSVSTVLGTGMAVIATTLVYVYLLRYSGLELLVRVQSDHDDPSKHMDYTKSTKLFDGALSILPAGTVRNHPMWILFFAHLRGNKKFRKVAMGLILVVVLVVAFPLITSAVFGSPDSEAAMARDRDMLYLLLAIFCLLMTKAFLLSSEFRASWVLFTAPIDLAVLWSFSDRLMRYCVAVPYLMLMFIVFCVFQLTESWFESLKQVIVFGLVLDLALKVKSGIEVNVPFSQGPEVMGKIFGQMAVVFVAVILANVCGAVIPLCTDRIEVFGGTILVLGLLSGLASILVRKRVVRKGKLLEFVV